MRNTAIQLPTLVAMLAVGPLTAAAAGGYANPQLLIETDELARLLAAGPGSGVRLVDLRRDPERGDAAYRAGHLPGAVYLAARELDDSRANAEGLPIRPEKAAALFGGLGIDQDTTVVAYCQSGTRSAHDYLALRLLGYARIKNYDGSWQEWGNDPSRPVKR